MMLDYLQMSLARSLSVADRNTSPFSGVCLAGAQGHQKALKAGGDAKRAAQSRQARIRRAAAETSEESSAASSLLPHSPSVRSLVA